MRIKTYLRIAPTSRGYKVSAHRKRPTEPHRAGYDPLLTIVIGLTLDIPTSAWEIPEAVVTVPEGAAAVITAEVEDA